MVTDGPMEYGKTRIEIKIMGKGGHGSEPALSVDPITAACQVHAALHTIHSRRLYNSDVLSFTICEFNAGSTYNVIPSDAYMQGSIRYLDKDVKDRVVCAIDDIATNVA